MAHANCASDFGGMHQHGFNHGLRSFFLAYDEPSPDSRHPRSRTPPSDPRASATTTARSPPGIAAGDRHQPSFRLPIQETFARRFNCSFWFRAASSPSSTQRRRTRATVVATPMPRASAISPSVRHPPDIHRTATEYAHASASGLIPDPSSLVPSTLRVLPPSTSPDTSC